MLKARRVAFLFASSAVICASYSSKNTFDWLRLFATKRRTEDRVNLSNSLLFRIARPFQRCRVKAAISALAILSSFLPAASSAATLVDFGYQNLAVDGVLALKPRPLLVILVAFGSGASLGHPAAYYDDLIFNSSRQPSMNGYFLAVSKGRFHYSRGGTIGPLALPANEKEESSKWPNPTTLRDTLFSSNVVWHAMTSGLFDFASYDANHDGHVTPDELAIIILSNDGTYTGDGSRYAGVVRPAGSKFDWGGGNYPNVSILNQDAPFIVMCEETEETLGCIDIYSGECLSEGLTPQSCFFDNPDGTNTYYLDAWHRMKLGWCEPRIRSLTAGGIETIPAAQMAATDAPIILYDPARGTNEFFMLEYRTQTSPSGAGYDANVATNGLAIWHVQQDAYHSPTQVPRFDAGPLPAQDLWRYCSKCQGLHYITDANSPVYGPCPAGGVHTNDSTTDYGVVLSNPSAPGQHGWNWCHKCQGLFFGPDMAKSHCPAGGTHDGSMSGDYSLILGITNSPGQHGWNYCKKCAGMFYGPNAGSSFCPAGGKHDGSASGDYAMLEEGLDLVVWNEGPPNLQRGSSLLWGSDATTPNLRWLIGGTLTHIHVLPFNSGDGSITVQWLSPGDTWVDFSYTGLPQNGTFANPFPKFAQGVGAVSYGGTLHIKTGSSAETGDVTKAMTIQAYNGPVTIGHP
jgi:M6 family metalloprotease-like protein